MLTQNEINQELKKLKWKQLKVYKKFILQGYTLEQAKIKVKERNPTCTYYWIAQGYSQEQAKLKIKQRKKICIEYWLKLYNEEQAKIKHEEYMKTVSPTCIEYWLRKGYSQEQGYIKMKEKSQATSKRIAKQYNKSQTKTCKEYWISKGYTQEEAIIKAKQHNRSITRNIPKQVHRQAKYKYLNNMTQQQKIKYAQQNKKHSQRMKAKNKTHSPIFLQYWLAKGYTKQQAKLQVQNVRYGNRKDNKASKIQTRCFAELSQYLHIQFKLQKWITINKSNYCIDAKYKNFVFQFNGTNFHMDSRFYKEGNKNPKGVLFEEVKKKDNKKIEDYKIKNFNILIIWEFDYINNKEKLFEQIKKEIQNGQKSNTKNLYWDSSSIFNECGRYT